MNKMAKIIMQYRIAIEHDDKGLTAMGIDIGRKVAEPLHIRRGGIMHRHLVRGVEHGMVASLVLAISRILSIDWGRHATLIYIG